jgi:hypothetical protein
VGARERAYIAWADRLCVHYVDAKMLTDSNGQVAVTVSFGSAGARYYSASFDGETQFVR